MYVATYSYTGTRRFQVTEIMPDGQLISLVDQERMSDTHTHMDVLGIDLDFDNWPDFLHPMSYPYEWSKNSPADGGKRAFINQNSQYPANAPMKAYEWPFSAVDMTNRNVSNVFFHFAFQQENSSIKSKS